MPYPAIATPPLSTSPRPLALVRAALSHAPKPTEPTQPRAGGSRLPAGAILTALRRADADGATWIADRAGEFEAFVSARLAPADGPDAALAAMRLVDLALVFGCLAGNEAALRAFDARIVARLGRELRDSESDVTQELVVRLFVPACGAPRALGYQGRGSLLGWVRVSAHNFVRSFHRRKSRTLVVHAPCASECRPDAMLADQQHQGAFMASLRAAVAALSQRDRDVLRLHELDKRTLREIADVYGVHRETAGLWLAKARARLRDDTRRVLRETLSISREEADAIVDSAIDGGAASIGSLLCAPPRSDA